MQIIHNILFARIICRSGEAKKCARYVWSAYVLARRNWHGPRRSPPWLRVRVCVCACVCARVHAHGRALVSTQSRVVINFNKTLGVRRDRALCEQEEEEEGAERERERESRFDTTHIRSLRMHTSTLDCTLVPCNKIL